MMPQRSAFEQELADDGRILSSLSWLRQSGFTTRVSDERMVIFGAGGVICAYCYSADEVVAFARRQSPVRGASMAGMQPATDQGPAGHSGQGGNPGRRAEDVAPMQTTRVHDLEETIRYLRTRWHTTVAERDEWERRARAAEQEADTLRLAAYAATAAAATAPANAAPPKELDPKYLALRRFLARELHPDATAASDQIRRVKSELFKLVWAEVAKLDKS